MSLTTTETLGFADGVSAGWLGLLQGGCVSTRNSWLTS